MYARYVDREIYSSTGNLRMRGDGDMVSETLKKKEERTNNEERKSFFISQSSLYHLQVWKFLLFESLLFMDKPFAIPLNC
jgi:hypothetical protein